MGASDFQKAAKLYQESAHELESASRHCRIAADHFLDEDAPRGAAHAFSAVGHIVNAKETLESAARLHVSNSQADL